MKKHFYIFIVFIISLSHVPNFVFCQKTEPVDFVDPFICTKGDHGHWHPSALVPFGLVHVGPDTYPGSLTGDGDLAHSGYDFDDSSIRGFSHFRLGSSGGASVSDRSGNFSLLPYTSTPGAAWVKHPVVSVDKSREDASPGYYTTYLDKEGVQVELSATTRCAIHKYQYAANKDAKIFLYEGQSGLEGKISYNIKDPYTIEGKGMPYFKIVFNQPILNIEKWDGSNMVSSAFSAQLIENGFSCDFGEITEPLIAKISFSLVSLLGARRNFDAEVSPWNFEQIKLQASEHWNETLNNISIKGSSERDKTIFYTALYHTCFHPMIQSDVDGRYFGMDKQIHSADGYEQINGYAFWDTFRNKYPLYSLYLPGAYRNVLYSIKDIYNQAVGYSPFPASDHSPHGSSYRAQGKDGHRFYNTVRHEHMLMVVVDAYFKGLFREDLDINDFYDYLKSETLLQMPASYDEIGYIPKRADQTGEYSMDNWAVAKIANELGHTEDYEYFNKRANYWKNTWDPSIKYFRARAENGSWLDFPNDPTINREKYTYEGSKWHWRWNALHDVTSLISLFGGFDDFTGQLEYFFDNDLYTAGNQIDLHAPYLFNYAGVPSLTQKWTYKILKEPITQLYGTHDFFDKPITDYIYKDTPDGYLLEMDGDLGCMASWYVLSAMGLYQVCPGETVYQITTPIFSEITLDLDTAFYDGSKFTIKAENLSDDNFYIQSATLNGEPIDRQWLTHNEITQGGELVLVMGNNPGQFGTSVKKVTSNQSAQLAQNYPNPFSSGTTINYSIQTPGFVAIKVYDSFGKEIKTLFEGKQDPGNYSVFLDGQDMSNGVYIYTLETKGGTQFNKMLLLK